MRRSCDAERRLVGFNAAGGQPRVQQHWCMRELEQRPCNSELRGMRLVVGRHAATFLKAFEKQIV
jgi:hypothetical protein